MVGAAAAASDTTLRLDGEPVGIEQYAVSVLGGRRWGAWALRASVGAVIGGTITENNEEHEIGAGVMGGVGVAREWPIGPWFISGSLGVSASRASTTAAPGAPTESITATDVRIGAMAGRTFGPASPYVLARAFGGPVFWTLDGTEVSGGDEHHYQLGAGVAVRAGDWSLMLDVSALGERSASLGAALHL